MRYKVRVNGTYLSDLVPGYITMDVKGREQADNEITSLTSERVDGEEYRYRRRNPRTITIKFAISTGSMEELTEAHNKLKAALSVEQAKFIFDDEPDKYWIGTPVSMEVEHLRPDTTTGEISVKVHKPYKYGLAESNVPFVDGVAEVYYSGTVPTYPVIHADMTANDGYISFSKDEETIMFGNEEDDGTTPTDPDAAVEYISNRDGLPTAGERWTYNDGILPYVMNPTSATGTMAVTATARNLYASNFGTNNNSWHGPCLTYHLEGSKSDCEFSTYFSLGARTNDQCGLAQFSIASDSANVAAVSIFKSSKGTLNGGYDLYVKGTRKKNISVSVAEGNKSTTNSTCTIKKKGSTITFSIGGASYQFTDASLADVAVTRLTIFFAKKAAETQLSINHVTGFRFTSPDESVEMHTFWDGDQVEIDCGQGQIKVNGAETPSIGRVRNAWEKMQLVPGKNVFTMDYSDWADTPPSARLTYREVYA